MCQKYQLGEVNTRRSPSFGVLPVHQTQAGLSDPVFDGLADPFYAVDSRSWQVIHPEEKQKDKQCLQKQTKKKKHPKKKQPQTKKTNQKRDNNVSTQFHPEADAIG